MPAAPATRRPGLHRSWPQRLILGAVGAVVLFCLLGAGGVGYMYWRVDSGVERLALGSLQQPEAQDPGAPQNILIVGSDSRAGLDPNAEDAFAFGDEADAGGKRSDTIMILHIEPRRLSASLLSLPRDLYVPLDAGGSGRINSAYSNGPDSLIRTIKNNFDIDIAHYVEVDFEGFKSLTEALGGIKVPFPLPARDINTGLDVPTVTAPYSCVALTGDQALAYVRSRHYEYKDSRGRWQTDQTSDFGRIARQQDFMKRAMKKLIAGGFTNPLQLNALIGVATSSLAVDQTFDTDTLFDLARHYRSFDPDQLVTYSLPVDGKVIGGADVLVLRKADAEPIFQLFRGNGDVQPTEAEVRVHVSNGTSRAGLANQTAAALAYVGFTTTGTGNVGGVNARTAIKFGPAQRNAAELLARHLESGADLVEDPARGGDLELVLGDDFTTVLQEARAPGITTAPVKAPPPAADGSATPTTGGGSSAGQDVPSNAHTPADLTTVSCT